jgi:hypothetical protein
VWLARRARGLVEPWRTGAEYLAFYARVAHQIFLAVAVFRLLGFDLSSGYRRPFLSHSFSELFRRFNHYVRDAVVSLFYFPLIGHLRGRMSARAAAIVASYVAIFVGSFVLNDLLVPVAVSIDPVEAAAYHANLVHVASLLLYWTLIILPSAGVAPGRRAPPADRRRRWLQIAAVNVVFFGIWWLQRQGGQVSGW